MMEPELKPESDVDAELVAARLGLEIAVRKIREEAEALYALAFPVPATKAN